MSSDKFHCTNGHCVTDCVLSSIDYDEYFQPKHCPHSGIAVHWKKCETTEKKPTIFHRITASPEVLAPYCIVDYYSGLEVHICYSTVTKKWYKKHEEAIAATVAKLKEVYNE